MGDLLSPETSFSGFSFDKDCQETKKNIPQGNAFNFEVDTRSVSPFDFSQTSFHEIPATQNNNMFNNFSPKPNTDIKEEEEVVVETTAILPTTSNSSFTGNTFSFVDNLQNPSKFSLV